MNIYDEKDGERGPTIQRNNINQRELNSKFLTNLTQELKIGKRTTDEKTVLIMICSKNYVQADSLASTINELDLKSRINWTSLSKEGTITLANGQHRMVSNVHLVRDSVKGIHELKIKIPKLEAGLLTHGPNALADSVLVSVTPTGAQPLVPPSAAKKGKGKKDKNPDKEPTVKEELESSRRELKDLEDNLESNKMWGVKIYDAGK